jgi:hypothetical protein
MLRYGLTALLVLLLLGCETPEQRAARVQAEVEDMIRVYGPGCQRLGYAPDSDPWRQCILRLRARDDIRYSTYPTTTTCIGHRGFFNCTTY